MTIDHTDDLPDPMSIIRQTRPSSALAVVTVSAAVIGAFLTPSAAQALPNDGSAMCQHLLNMANMYTETALNYDPWNPAEVFWYNWYMDLAGHYIDASIGARC